LPFVFTIKLPAIMADVAMTAVIYHIGRRWGYAPIRAAFPALLYALNPLSIVVAAYHGQFDAIPLLLLLLSWYYWHFGRRLGLSAVALGLAVLSKTWPLLFLPVVLSRLPSARKWLVYGTVTMAIPILFTALYLLFFPADARPLLGRALTHTGVPGYWGVTGLLNLARTQSDLAEALYDYFVNWRRILLVAAGAFALGRTWRQGSLDALTTILLTMLAVTAGMGLQWLLWVAPFALLAGDIRGLNWYTAGAVTYLVLQLYGYHFSPWLFEVFDPATARNLLILTSYPAWIVVIVWAVRRLLPGYTPQGRHCTCQS
jgi:hypothetical protein